MDKTVECWNRIRASAMSERVTSSVDFSSHIFGSITNEKRKKMTICDLNYEVVVIRKEIEESWSAGNRLESFKIILEASKVMTKSNSFNSSDVLYPIQAFEYFDLLECFGALVKTRIRLNPELGSNWEHKILSIKDFAPRAFLHALLLDSIYSMNSDETYEEIGSILFKMNRGFGSVTVSLWYQMFILYRISLSDRTNSKLFASKLAKNIFKSQNNPDQLSLIDKKNIFLVRFIYHILSKSIKPEVLLAKTKETNNFILLDGYLFNQNTDDVITNCLTFDYLRTIQETN